jgi:hypothetical protein
MGKIFFKIQDKGKKEKVSAVQIIIYKLGKVK